MVPRRLVNLGGHFLMIEVDNQLSGCGGGLAHLFNFFFLSLHFWHLAKRDVALWGRLHLSHPCIQLFHLQLDVVDFNGAIGAGVCEVARSDLQFRVDRYTNSRVVFPLRRHHIMPCNGELERSLSLQGNLVRYLDAIVVVLCALTILTSALFRRLVLFGMAHLGGAATGCQGFASRRR